MTRMIKVAALLAAGAAATTVGREALRRGNTRVLRIRP